MPMPQPSFPELLSKNELSSSIAPPLWTTIAPPMAYRNTMAKGEKGRGKGRQIIIVKEGGSTWAWFNSNRDRCMYA